MVDIISRILIFIVNPVIQLLLAIAVAYFFWGIAKYMIAKNKGSDISEYARHITWGVLGITIMLSAFGIMKFITEVIDADEYVQVDTGGDITIIESAFPD